MWQRVIATQQSYCRNASIFIGFFLPHPCFAPLCPNITQTKESDSLRITWYEKSKGLKIPGLFSGLVFFIQKLGDFSRTCANPGMRYTYKTKTAQDI